MPSYKFKLQRVLEYRERREELLQQELAALMMALLKEQDELNRLISSYRKNENELKVKREKKIDLKEIDIYRKFLERMKEKIISQRNRVVHLSNLVSNKREELIEASKEKKVLERLKEKDFGKYLLNLDRKERAFLDELALGKFVREKGGESAGTGRAI